MALNFEKIAHQGRAIRRQDAFRMELHSLDGRERWRTPMISPCAVRADTSSTGGMLAGSAIKE